MSKAAKIFRSILGIPEPQPPLKDGRGWSEDWQIGDLARCIDGCWSPVGQYNPKEGDVLRVNAMSEGKVTTSDTLVSGLGFEGKPRNTRWDNTGFVKIRPDHSADEIDVGIIAKIKRGAKQGEPA